MLKQTFSELHYNAVMNPAKKKKKKKSFLKLKLAPLHLQQASV